MLGLTHVDYGVNLTLKDRRMVSFRRFPRRSQIVCLEGKLWVTFQGDPADYLLEPGDWLFPKRSRRRPIVYAVGRSELVMLADETRGVTGIFKRLIGRRFAYRL